MHSTKQLIMHIWLNSTKPIARGSGGMPQKNLKIKPSKNEPEGIFNSLLPGLLQGSTMQNNYHTAIWLSSRLHYLSIRNCITSLRNYITTIKWNTSRCESHYNTKNTVHEYYYMLRRVLMQLQKSTFAASINAWI